MQEKKTLQYLQKMLLVFVFVILFLCDVLAAACSPNINSKTIQSSGSLSDCYLEANETYNFNTITPPSISNSNLVPSNITFDISDSFGYNATISSQSIVYNSNDIKIQNDTKIVLRGDISNNLTIDTNSNIEIYSNNILANLTIKTATIKVGGNINGKNGSDLDITQTATNLISNYGYTKILSDSTSASSDLITLTNAGNISRIFFIENKVVSSSAVIGGIISNRGSSKGIGTLENLVFQKINIEADITGGGIIGINSQSIGNITRVVINNTVYKGNSAFGGGLLGAQNGSIGNLHSVKFTDNKLEFGNNLSGGGIAGIYGIDPNPTIPTNETFTFGNMNNVFFENSSITFKDFIFHGGGVFGVATGDSNKKISVGIMEKVEFNDNTINNKKGFWGGGIMGFHYNTADSSNSIGVMKDFTFAKNKVTVDTSGTGKTIFGGGIFGGVNAKFDKIETITFDENEVDNSTDKIQGGGVIGLYDSTIGNITSGDFKNNTIKALKIEGGGVIGIYGIGNIGNIRANFKENTVETTDVIKGGGVIGGYGPGSGFFGSIGGDDELTTKDFLKNTIKALKIEGGGIIGFNNYNSGSVMFAVFNENKIESEIEGGGVVGINNKNGIAISIRNSDFKNNTINSINGPITKGGGIIGYNLVNKTGAIGSQIISNNFENNTIGSITKNIYGGGVIGLYDSKIISITNSIFIDNKVNANDLSGGGVIGATEKSNINLISITDPLITDPTFTTNKIKAKNINGGGVIGAIDESTITSIITNFKENTIEIGDDIKGSGIIGFYNKSKTNVITADFIKNTITTTNNNIQGGGLIGGYGYDAYSKSNIGAITSNFDTNKIEVKQNIEGGGLIGVFNSTISSITSNSILSNNVKSSATIYGGGIIGGINSNIGNTTIDLLEKNIIEAGTNIQGGGIIGAFNSTIAEIRIIFNSNEITAKKSIEGGGIIGATNNSNSNSIIGDIKDSTFSNNTITAKEQILGGGIIGATEYSKIGNIENTLIRGNTITSDTDSIKGGLIGLRGYQENTGTNSLNDYHLTNDIIFSNTTNVPTNKTIKGSINFEILDNNANISIDAENGKSTFYKNNIIDDTDGKRTNSFYFDVHHKTNINFNVDGDFYLFDPIYITPDTQLAVMTSINIKGTNNLYWGGDNVIATNTKIFMDNKTQIYLLNGFKLTTDSSSKVGIANLISVNDVGKIEKIKANLIFDPFYYWEDTLGVYDSATNTYTSGEGAGGNFYNANGRTAISDCERAETTNCNFDYTALINIDANLSFATNGAAEFVLPDKNIKNVSGDETNNFIFMKYGSFNPTSANIKIEIPSDLFYDFNAIGDHINLVKVENGEIKGNVPNYLLQLSLIGKNVSKIRIRENSIYSVANFIETEKIFEVKTNQNLLQFSLVDIAHIDLIEESKTLARGRLVSLNNIVAANDLVQDMLEKNKFTLRQENKFFFINIGQNTYKTKNHIAKDDKYGEYKDGKNLKTQSVNIIGGVNKTLNDSTNYGFFNEVGYNKYDEGNIDGVMHDGNNMPASGYNIYYGLGAFLSYNIKSFYIDLAVHSGLETNKYQYNYINIDQKPFFLYASALTGIGYMKKIDDEVKIDTFLKYKFAFINKHTSNITNVDELKFAQINSNRIKGGITYYNTPSITKRNVYYFGINGEYELGIEQKAVLEEYQELENETKKATINAPSIKGFSYGINAGFKFSTETVDYDFSVELMDGTNKQIKINGSIFMF